MRGVFPEGLKIRVPGPDVESRGPLIIFIGWIGCFKEVNSCPNTNNACHLGLI